MAVTAAVIISGRSEELVVVIVVSVIALVSPSVMAPRGAEQLVAGVVRSESLEDDSLDVESVVLSVVAALVLPERLDDALAEVFAGVLEGVLEGLFYGVLEGDEGGSCM